MHPYEAFSNWEFAERKELEPPNAKEEYLNKVLPALCKPSFRQNTSAFIGYAMARRRDAK